MTSADMSKPSTCKAITVYGTYKVAVKGTGSSYSSMSTSESSSSAMVFSSPASSMSELASGKGGVC